VTEAAISHGSIVILLLLLAIASGTDMQQHRIPNVLSLGGIILGIALQGWASGFSGIIAGVGGAAVGIGIFLPFYLAHGMGAGDVKLMGAAGAFLGPTNALLATGLSLAAGGVIAIIILLLRGGLVSLLKRYRETLKCFLYTRKVAHHSPAAGDVAAMKFPYAAAIGIGTVATLWWVKEIQELTKFLLLSS
jgi:prepilin peptidase CpaA